MIFKRRKNRTRKPDENPLASRVIRGDDRPTIPLEAEQNRTRDPGQDPGDDAAKAAPGRRGAEARPEPNAGLRRVASMEEPPTRIVTPADSGTNDSTEALTRPIADLPVGVLLVLEGPGRGGLLPVNPGVSDIGRGQGARLRLDFGDKQIARNGHAVITYDSLGRRFFVQHGGGHNLTWLDGEPVLEPLPLPDGARLRVGMTELLFRNLLLSRDNHEGAPADP
ncbi:MAG: FHA domain-containing protein [Xanthomonadales bacterium]|jgi:pSer/pThr/pTyr-binding forkhead associated (FHA) protein|nr:FHA domain-containing protein [Xanthomonadales bacterium]